MYLKELDFGEKYSLRKKEKKNPRNRCSEKCGSFAG